MSIPGPPPLHWFTSCWRNAAFGWGATGNRYTNETRRLYGVMDKQLSNSRFIACNQYTVADIAIFPWVRSWEDQGIDWADLPHLKAWFDRVSARPAVQRGVEVLAELRKPFRDEKQREILFGSTQYPKR